MQYEKKIRVAYKLKHANNDSIKRAQKVSNIFEPEKMKNNVIISEEAPYFKVFEFAYKSHKFYEIIHK